LSCYINENKVKDYKSGDAFGELALLYNAPRAATICADENCHLFSLDRHTFNHIVKDSSVKKRTRYE
jgi:cAMP-dependent protein kinase regulator